MPGHIPDEMVDTFTAAGPIDKVRERVETVAARGDGLWLTPPTYFLPPEQLAEYQSRIIQEFGPAAPSNAPAPRADRRTERWSSRSRTC